MRPRERGSTPPPIRKHLPVTEMSAKRHLFITMPKRHSPLFPLGWGREGGGGPGNLLQDCVLSGERLCLGLYLGCKDAAGRFPFSPFLKGGCTGPIHCDSKKQPTPRFQAQSVLTPCSSSHLLTLTYLCLHTDLDDLTLQPYPPSLNFPTSLQPSDLSAPQTRLAYFHLRTFVAAVPFAWNAVV